MLPPGVEGMRWEMLAFLFTIGSPIWKWHSKMDIQELVTNMCKEKKKEEEKGNQAILLLFMRSSILIHL